MTLQTPTQLETPIHTPVINIYNSADLRRYAEGTIWGTYFSTRNQSPTWRAILDGKVTDKRSVPEGYVHTKDFLDFLVQFLTYIRQTEPTLVAVRDSLLDHDNPIYRKTVAGHFQRHAASEMEHDLLIKRDITRLGYDPDKTLRENPVTEAVRKYVVRAKLMSRDPDMAIAKLMEGIILEGQADIWATNFCNNLKQYGNFPEKENVLEFMGLHGAVDSSVDGQKGHKEQGLDLLGQEGIIALKDYPKLIAEAELVSGFYVQLAKSLHERSLERRLGMNIK